MGGAAHSAEGRGVRPITLSLVIPAYNEEARLPALLDALAGGADAAVSAAGLELAEILIVDDGSTDRTAALVRAAGAENPRLQPGLGFDANRGKGAAFAAGVERAGGEYVLLADVDLSTPLSELGKLVEAVDAGADIAIGSRAVSGSIVERGPMHRKMLGRGFNATVRLLTGLGINDTQCGFKLMPAAAARALVAEQICPGFAFDVELLLRADLAGLRIAEVPVTYVHDSRSSIRPVVASGKMLMEVSRVAVRLRMPPRPASAPALTELSADDSD